MKLQTLEIHPLAEQFPEMLEQEFEALVASIETDGLKEPLLLFEGKVLDGRHRYRACLQLGIEPGTRPFKGTQEEAESLSIAQNLSRRHLTASQKAMLIAMHGLAAKPKSSPSESAGKRSIRDAAKHFGVNHMMIYKAFNLLELSSDSAQDVFAGKLSLTKAIAFFKQQQAARRDANWRKTSVVVSTGSSQPVAVPQVSFAPRVLAEKGDNKIQIALKRIFPFIDRELTPPQSLVTRIEECTNELIVLLEDAEQLSATNESPTS